MSGNLTAEQLRRIEENRKKALAKRAKAAASVKNSSISHGSVITRNQNLPAGHGSFVATNQILSTGHHGSVINKTSSIVAGNQNLSTDHAGSVSKTSIIAASSQNLPLVGSRHSTNKNATNTAGIENTCSQNLPLVGSRHSMNKNATNTAGIENTYTSQSSTNTTSSSSLPTCSSAGQAFGEVKTNTTKTASNYKLSSNVERDIADRKSKPNVENSRVVVQKEFSNSHNSAVERNRTNIVAPASGETSCLELTTKIKPPVTWHTELDQSVRPCCESGRIVTAQGSASDASQSHIDYDKIEQNRLKALAKRAEKLSKSPLKSSTIAPPSTDFLNSDKVPPNNSNSHDSWLNKSSGHSSASQTSVNNDSVPAGKLDQNTAAASNTGGQNIFQMFSGTPVKGGCFLVSRDRFEVKVGYSEPLIQLFKTMETKLYDAVTKKWSFKLSEYNKFMAAVKHLKPAVDIEALPKAIITTFSAQIRGENCAQRPPVADLSRVEQSLVNSLMPFQREGVNFGIHQNGRVLIADDMGLGKTIQAICLACYYRSEWPLLVVVPSSVRFDWAQNFQRWVPSLDPQSVNVVVTGKDSSTSGRINILSYDLMARQASVLKNKRFQIIIMDESHLLKNYKTARCKAAMPLLQNARRVILLSGTPALSRPSELYTQINAVSPYLFSFHDFGVRYCDGKQLPWGWDYSGSSNMEELQILLSEKIMIRRLKKDVLTELPDKIRQMILLDPGSIKIDKELKLASKVMSSGNLKKIEERGALLDFFHKSGTAKLKAIRSYVEDMLESEKKFLIFAHHGDVLDAIEETVKATIKDKYIRIDGRTLSEQRNIFCEKFQVNESIKVAILSITAANAGLDLSSANVVVFAELFWNPGILVQAEDRAHRIGQQDMVNVQYLVARGTSDDHIWPMIQKKLDVLGKAGLSKDNFSSAETTRLTDQRQEEITRFLEASFCDDSFTEGTGGDVSSGRQDGEAEFGPSPSKGFKQSSILKFTSPMKISPDFGSTNSSPTKDKKQKGLFKYFSPQKASSSNSNGGLPEPSSSKGQSLRSSCEDECHDNDLEEFLKDSDDEWSDSEPVIKKRKM